MPSAREQRVAVIGAGPAGLTAAYLLTKRGIKVTVIESDPATVGGIARTVKYRGYHFDIGGHRFFSRSQQINDLWSELLPEDFLVRPRSSRIYYRGKLFSYPLRPLEALRKLGFRESLRCLVSYIKARLLPDPFPKSFEAWVTNQFGKRLFQIFFKTYTEKVWGMSCRDISADWAAQRIKGLSLGTAIFDAIRSARRGGDGKEKAKSLIQSFRYPRRGPGMLWEACAEKIKRQGGAVLMGRRVEKCAFDSHSGNWHITSTRPGGEKELIVANHVISSMPLRELITQITPSTSESSRQAADRLRYRDFLIVLLIVKGEPAIADNWLYIHDPALRVGRIQNFRAWSPEMVPDPSTSSYGLEYFCTEGDDFWRTADENLIEFAGRELVQIGLVHQHEIIEGCVVRQRRAYPVYDEGYRQSVELIRRELETRFPTLHLVGRNGMHRYNNQDHSMMTAMLTVDNILAGRRQYDVWCVNEDAEYHERLSTSAGESRLSVS